MVATLPDLLRLLAVPFFGYVAWRDIETRRVPNETWYPLGALAVGLLLWDAVRIFGGDVAGFQRQLFAIQVVVSLGIVAPLAYLFWRIGGFGGADAKAFFVVAVLFPAYPAYTVAEAGLNIPLVVTDVRVFSLTILSNTVLVGLAYPLLLAARNAAAGHVSPGMFVAKPIRPGDAIDEYGSMLTFADRSLADDLSLAGLRAYFSWRGLDLDAMRMYLQWRGATLAEIRAEPEQYRDPASLPAEPNPPGDGAIATDGGTDAGEPVDDPWGAAAFLEDIEGSAYGTTPETLREGLDSLVADDVIWISPGIPFLVPLFGGLVVALTYGDLLFGILRAVGPV